MLDIEYINIDEIDQYTHNCSLWLIGRHDYVTPVDCILSRYWSLRQIMEIANFALISYFFVGPYSFLGCTPFFEKFINNCYKHFHTLIQMYLSISCHLALVLWQYHSSSFFRRQHRYAKCGRISKRNVEERTIQFSSSFSLW